MRFETIKNLARYARETGDGVHMATDATHEIVNALRVAAEEFDKHAKEFRALEAGDTTDGAGDMPIVTKDGFKRLAEQFERQAKDVRKAIDLIERADEVVLINVEPEEEEDED